MISDFTAVFVVIIFTIIAFFSALKNGVVKLLASGCAAALALAVFFAGMHLIQGIAQDNMEMDLSATASVGASIGIAVVVYFIALIIFSLIFKAVFGPDSPLHGLVDGLPGAVLSLFPSAVVAVFIFTCVRVAGTVQELNYAASLSQENIQELTRRIPPYPFSANWRNGIEDVPMLAPVLDLLDPFSNRLNRNAGAMAIMHNSVNLRTYLLSQPESATLAAEDSFMSLRREKDVRQALDKQNRIGLILNQDLQEAAQNSENVDELRELDLKRILVGFGKTLQPDEPNLQE